MKSAIDDRLTSLLQNIEIEFNADWKLPLIEKILNGMPDNEEELDKLPVIRKAWLEMIPTNCHPLFEFLIEE